jgi:hypothetical protein
VRYNTTVVKFATQQTAKLSKKFWNGFDLGMGDGGR